jgi:uncharacterized RDD family membrane protein YckC
MISQQFQNKSIEDIATEHKSKIFYRRMFGLIIDFIFFSALIMGADFLLGNQLYQDTLFVWLALPLVLFGIGEFYWGRTPGKLLTGTIVVQTDGSLPNIKQVFIRQILWPIEATLSGPIYIIAFTLSKRCRRLADLIANTYVVCKCDIL